ncbi:hypothetical protein HMPREF0501_01623 [Limosilactobacillus coleohominis 101-4-CHN]|uniref:Uncharacterized protein n=1 Tax=Limosilactobacillus coleohominis 101-4-CHN TaxID=575594 RepID=C7XXY8_9LACO|nr:hypothetical protein HMPREF0501_01623 [Limosilactobacillus coleohominis 101-4-CHN]
MTPVSISNFILHVIRSERKTFVRELIFVKIGVIDKKKVIERWKMHGQSLPATFICTGR